MPPVRCIAICLVLAGTAAPASATTFYVDDNGAGPPTPGCQDAAHPCTTILAALTASRAAAGTGDTIDLAAGTYAEDVAIDQPQDNGLTIEGAGLGLGGSKIALVSNAAQAVKLGAQSAPLNTNLTLKNLSVGVPVGSDTSKTGVVDAAVGSTLQDVTITVSEPASAAAALVVSSGSGTNTLDHVVIVSVSSVEAVALFGAATTTMTHSGVQMSNTSAATAYGVVAVGTTLHLMTSKLKNAAASPSAPLVVATGATATVDSSLIEGGVHGVYVTQSTAGSAQATIRRSTIDAATPGVDDAGTTGASVYAETKTTAGTVATVNVTQSLLVDVPDAHAVSGVGTPTVACDTTITPASVNPKVACGAAGGNSTATPSALFVDAPNYDYDLKPGSPAVDAGSASGLAAGEPTADQALQPRLVDGNLDCIARPDLGALELQGQSNTPPTVSADGPATGATSATLSFTASGADAEDAAGALTYTWAFSDGATASGASVQHAFATAGTQSATVTVTDTHGCSASAARNVDVAAPAGAGGGPGPAPGAADTTAPRISAVSVKGRRLRYRLSEGATVRASLARRGRHAVRRRWAGHAGQNTATLPRLSAGRYVLVLTATDAAGNASKPLRRALRVGRRRHQHLP